MKTQAPADAINLGALLFGRYRRDVLAQLLLHPEQSLHLRELARLTEKSAGTLARELNVLAEAGLLLRRRVGNQVHFQANPACPIYEELRGILKKTSGLADVLREALQPLERKIASAFVFGSIARGDERPGSDVDVMVVGRAGFADVVMALAPAQEALRREINPVVYQPGEFDSALKEKEPFLLRVMEDKKIYLVGGADDAREPAPDRKAPRARRKQG